MSILDIHTHLTPHVAGEAIENVLPSEFTPLRGHYYSVGYHPWNVSADNTEDWSLLSELAQHPQVLAIGEAGFDKLRGVDMKLQENAFIRQSAIAEENGKPLIIHCVKSFNELIRLKQTLKPTVPWVIHGFRGKPQLALQLLMHDFYLSFGEYYQRDALSVVPVDRLFLETDDSHTSISSLYQNAAALLGLSSDELLRLIALNICSVFAPPAV